MSTPVTASDDSARDVRDPHAHAHAGKGLCEEMLGDHVVEEPIQLRQWRVDEHARDGRPWRPRLRHQSRAAVRRSSTKASALVIGAGGLGHIGIQCLKALTAAYKTLAPADRARFEAAAQDCYRHAGIPWPGVVAWVPSPVVLALAQEFGLA